MNKKAGNAEEKQALRHVFFCNMITEHVFSFKTPEEVSIPVFTSHVFYSRSARILFLRSWLKLQLHFQVIKQETWLVGCISMVSSCLGKEVRLDVNIFLWLMKIILKLTTGKRAKSQHTEAVCMRAGDYIISLRIGINSWASRPFTWR